MCFNFDVKSHHKVFLRQSSPESVLFFSTFRLFEILSLLELHTVYFQFVSCYDNTIIYALHTFSVATYHISKAAQFSKPLVALNDIHKNVC